MWFKNLQIYKLSNGWDLAPGALEEELAKHPLRPCRGIQSQTKGWVSPRENGALVHDYEKHILIALGTEQKILPASVINDEAKERAAKLEQKQGFKPGRKQMREIKEAVAAELLPRAFAKRRTTRAWISPSHKWIAVDAATPARAEEVIETLRTALGELPVEPLATNQSPGAAMTQWLTTGEAPGKLALDQDCELIGADATKSTVRYVRHVLNGKDLRHHISGGKSASKLGLSWNSRISFVLHEQHQIKKVNFLDVEKNREDAKAEDKDEQFDADFALMTGEYSKLITELIKCLGGEEK